MPPQRRLHLQGKYILTPSPLTYGEEQLLHFLGQLLGIAIRADVPLPLDLLPSFWKTLVGEPLDPDQDLQEADVLTYNYVKKFESVSEKHSDSGGVGSQSSARVSASGPGDTRAPQLNTDWALPKNAGECAPSLPAELASWEEKPLAPLPAESRRLG